jgi:hypothetical protein
MAATREVAFEQARARWPEVRLDYQSWCSHLEALGWSGEPPPTAASLFLCCACARRDPAAFRSFEDAYEHALRSVVAREGRDEEFIDWVMRSARHQLFADAVPKIASYDGRRPLADWLRTFVQRLALAQKIADRAVDMTPPVPPAELRRL